MQSPLIIANWKSNFTINEAREWFSEITHMPIPPSKNTVILCPSFPLLPVCKDLIKEYNLPWKLGAQDVSPFDVGRHTGEVAALQLKDLVEYVLVGHSERREQFSETDEMEAQKVLRAKEAGLIPLFFAQNTKTPIPREMDIIVYEPPGAISPAPAESPEDVGKVAQVLRKNHKESIIVYGGNVTPENANSFISLPEIHGIIVGQASLDPKKFAYLIAYA